MRSCLGYWCYLAAGGMQTGGQGNGLPSNFLVSIGEARLADSSNAPDINSFTSIFFISALLGG
jgi:hypothetical protein